jgi:hemerythrin
MELLTYGQYLASFPELLTDSAFFEERPLCCDSRYRSLIGQLDAMIKRLAETPEYNLKRELNRLLHDMREHVSAENEFMALVCFPKAMVHRFHHLFICAYSNDLRDRARLGHCVSSGDLSYIRLLLLEHIHVHDRAFEEYLAPLRAPATAGET